MDFLEHTYPETPIPLTNKNVFELLVAVLLSAQCTDERVNKVTPFLFKMANNPFDMEKVPIDKIYNIIKPCGLAPQKSKAISNKDGVTLFTRSSVHWALSNTATNNSKTFLFVRGTGVSG